MTLNQRRKGMTKGEIIRDEVMKLERMLKMGLQGTMMYSIACASAYTDGVSVDVINKLESLHKGEVSSEEYLDNILMEVK